MEKSAAPEIRTDFMFLLLGNLWDRKKQVKSYKSGI